MGVGGTNQGGGGMTDAGNRSDRVADGANRRPPGLLALALLTLLAFLLAPAPVDAQTAELVEMRQRMVALMQAEKLAEAYAVASEAVAKAEAQFGDHPFLAGFLNDLGWLQIQKGELAAAKAGLERALAINTRFVGENSPILIASLTPLSEVADLEGEAETSRQLLERAERLLEGSPDDPLIPETYRLLLEELVVLRRASFESNRGNDEAELSKLERARTLRQAIYGLDSSQVEDTEDALVALYKKLGKYAEAAEVNRTILARLGERQVGEQTSELDRLGLGKARLNQEIILGKIGAENDRQRHWDRQAPIYRELLELQRVRLGPDHRTVAETLYKLAIAELNGQLLDRAEEHMLQALRMAKADPEIGRRTYRKWRRGLSGIYFNQGHYDRALEVDQGLLEDALEVDGSDAFSTGWSRAQMASLLKLMGRFEEAERAYLAGIETMRKTVEEDHTAVANAYRNLAALYLRWKRNLDQAEKLLLTALAAYEKRLGPESYDVALTLASLANIYTWTDRPKKEAEILERSFAIRRKTFPPNSPSIATAIANLASLYRRTRRPLKAVEYYKEAIGMFEASYGAEHWRLADMLGTYGELNWALGRYDRAEELYRRALKIRSRVLGETDETIATVYNNLARVANACGDHRAALEWSRKATAINLAAALSWGHLDADEYLAKMADVRDWLRLHLELVAVQAKSGADGAASTAEAFSLMQSIHATAVAVAASRMAARFAAGNSDLARLARQRQRLLDEIQKLGAGRLRVLASGNTGEARAIADHLGIREAELASLEGKLAVEHPDYHALIKPTPVPLAEGRNLLARDEALLSIAWSREKTFIVLVTRDGASLRAAGTGSDRVLQMVTELRDGLDLSLIRGVEDLTRFDTRLAWDLYRLIFGDDARELDGIRHLYIVAEGAFAALPFALLPTEPQNTVPFTFAEYRQVPWLARRMATTVLPSVSLFRSLRTLVRQSSASRPFAGFGDPALAPPLPLAQRGIAAVPRIENGHLASTAELRELPSLPETADELRQVSRHLGGAPEDVFLGPAATEAAVKTTALSDYRIVSFATHGIIAGELEGVAEPALILTPPAQPSGDDDGVLTASEIARLDLDAELVILSACNTAASGRIGGDALTGLASSFLLAGSRALIASHWPVSSKATVALMTGMFEIAAATPGIGWSESLRRSMLQLLDDRTEEYFAHPAFWAAFVHVGAR